MEENMEIDNSENIIAEKENELVSYDYTDRYYERILSDMENIKVNQETIIKNQDDIISKHSTSNLFSGATLFMICLFFVYYLVRNMIIVK